MDKIRSDFEEKIKRPAGVFWSDTIKEYDGAQSYYAQLAETYQAAWDAWQAAHALYTKTEAKGNK